MPRVRQGDNGHRADGEAPSLEAVFAGMQRCAPSEVERRWMNDLRARLGRDPGDAGALAELAGPRFRDLCETLGVTQSEGRERILSSLSRTASPESRPAAEQDPPPPAGPTGRPGASGSRWRLLFVTGVVAAVIAAGLLLPVREWLLAFLDWSRGLGVWGPICLAGLYVVGCVLLLPGSLLTLGAGFAFGLVRGLLAVMVGAVLGAAVAFLLGRTVARGWVEARLTAYPRFRAVDEAVAREGFKIVLLTRLSPLFPFNLLNYAFGVTKVSFRDYFFASLLGMFPGGLMYIYLGTAARSLAEVAAGGSSRGTVEHVLLGIGLVATVAVTVVITRIARRALRGEIGVEG